MANQLILFVHGLRGGANKTWGNWPKIIKDDDNVNNSLDIAMFEYETPLFGINNNNIYSPLFFPNMLRSFIETCGCEDVTIVAHSLGGLVAKQYLIEEVKNNAELRVKRLMLCGVPNEGTEIARYARCIFWNNPIFSRLCNNSDFTQMQKHDWASFKIEEKVSCVYVFGEKDGLVSYTYSCPPGIKPVIVPKAGHKNLVKPKGSDELIYKTLINLISTNSKLSNKQAEISNFSAKDKETIYELLSELPLDVMDYFFERAQCDIIIEDVDMFFTGFYYIVTASTFHIFDKDMKDRVVKFNELWSRCFSFGEYFYPRDKGPGYVFGHHNYRMPEVREAHEIFHQTLGECHGAYKELVNYIKNKYPEIDLKKTSADAREKNKKYIHDHSTH